MQGRTDLHTDEHSRHTDQKTRLTTQPSCQPAVVAALCLCPAPQASSSEPHSLPALHQSAKPTDIAGKDKDKLQCKAKLVDNDAGCVQAPVI